MDEPIVAKLQAGLADEAFALLVPAYRRRVFGLAYAILRDRAAAEDAAQETFMKLWRALPGFDGRAQLSTWVYAITRNAAISALRRRRPEASLADPAVEAAAESVALEAAGAEVAQGPDVADAALAREIEALPEKQRAVITLYYLEERPTEEVAAMLGMPVNTVKTHLHRARARLAERLATTGVREAAA
jgi:RNA polymerase sigma-70 factor (ECF subfamily)